MQNLSVLLSNEARYEEAAQLMNRAVEILRQHASPDDPNMLMALGNYASELMLLHQPVKAEPVMREALARSAKVLGPKHTDTLIVQLQLGDTLTMLHRYAEAEGLLRAAAEELERNEGPSNKYTMGPGLLSQSASARVAISTPASSSRVALRKSASSSQRSKATGMRRRFRPWWACAWCNSSAMPKRSRSSPRPVRASRPRGVPATTPPN